MRLGLLLVAKEFGCYDVDDFGERISAQQLAEWFVFFGLQYGD